MKLSPARIAVAVAAGAVLLGGGSAASALALAGHPAPVTVTVPATPSPAAPHATVKPPAKPVRPATPAPARTHGNGTHNGGTTYNGPVTIINQAPQPGSSVYVPAPDYGAPAYFTTNQGVVQQYYDLLNNKDFASAWAMGGKYIGGNDYNSWVAGYSTTRWVTLSTWDYYPGYNAVGVTISAEQTDGTIRTYAGSYTISGGVITDANITQTSGGSGSDSGYSAPASGLRYVGQLPSGGGVYANSDTSSPFAMAVAEAYAGGGGSDYESVYSPTTHQSYGMSYTNVVNETIQATGGSGVVVQFGYVP